jgi:hypothetical protein
MGLAPGQGSSKPQDATVRAHLQRRSPAPFPHRPAIRVNASLIVSARSNARRRLFFAAVLDYLQAVGQTPALIQPAADVFSAATPRTADASRITNRRRAQRRRRTDRKSERMAEHCRAPGDSWRLRYHRWRR